MVTETDAPETTDAIVSRIARSIILSGYAPEVDLEGPENDPVLTPTSMEQHALTAMVLQDDVIAAFAHRGVLPEDFSVPAHQLLYSTIVTLWGAGRAVDTEILLYELQGKETFEAIGGVSYLRQMYEGCFHIALAHAPDWAPVIHEAAQLRTLTAVGAPIRRAVLAAPDLATAIERAQEVLSRSIQQTGAAQSSPHSRDILRAADVAVTFGAPWPGLTFYTRGMARKQVWTLAGTSSHGKTTVALEMVHHALKEGLRVAYFNLDSDSAAILHRLIALEGDCSKAAAALPVKPQSAEGERAWAARERFAEGEWADAYKTYAHIRDRARILAEIRRHKLQYGLDLVVIDFIQNVTDGNLSEYDRLGRLMTDMQHVSQVEDVMVLLLSQTAMEQQKGMRPTDALNAKGNAAIKDNSDVFLSLYRDRFAKDEEAQHIMELTVQKVKEGATGPVFLWYDFLTGRCTPRPLDEQSPEYRHYMRQAEQGGVAY